MTISQHKVADHNIEPLGCGWPRPLMELAPIVGMSGHCCDTTMSERQHEANCLTIEICGV
jgi:hypothetical protein